MRIALTCVAMAAAVALAVACSDGEDALPSMVEGFALPDDGVVVVSSRAGEVPESTVTVFTNESLESLRSRFGAQAGPTGARDWTLCADPGSPEEDSWHFRALDGRRTLDLKLGASGERSETRSYISFTTAFGGDGADCRSPG